jgi:nucleoside-diphosphate-sugar epimerase
MVLKSSSESFLENNAIGFQNPYAISPGLPWGNESTVLPLVAAEAVARVAVGLLTGPQPAAGSFHRLIGTTISLKEIVATFARVTGKNVHYEEITDEQWRRDVASRGFNPHAIEHLSSLWRAIRGAAIEPNDPRYAITEAIQTVGGAKPKTFEAFVRETQGELLAKSA